MHNTKRLHLFNAVGGHEPSTTPSARCTNRRLSRAAVALVTGLLGLGVYAQALAPTAPAAPAQATPPSGGLTRTLVGRGDTSIPNREAVVMRVEVAPGASAGWHVHPGEEISYVLEGEGTLLMAGQAPRKVSAGQSFVIPGGVVHNAVNSGTVPIKLIGVFVVEKGVPLGRPADTPAGQ